MSFSDAPISFPGLFGDWQFTVPSKALNIGNGIYWYGIIIAAGMLLGLYFCMKQAPKYGLSEDNIIDTVLWVIPFSIIGARIYYVLFYLDLFRGSDGSINWSSTYRIWDGGLAIYGGVIAGFLTAYLFSRRRKISFWALADCCVQGLFIGQAIGRWGNFMNREAFGAATELPWRMRLWTSATTYMDVHPTFLYESLWNVIGLLLLYFVVSRARRFDGENTCFYFIWYGLGRFWIEGLRTDSLYLFHWTLFGQRIRVSQALSLVMVLVCAGILVYQFKVKKADGSNLFVKRMQQTTEAEEAAAHQGVFPCLDAFSALQVPTGGVEYGGVAEALQVGNLRQGHPAADVSGLYQNLRLLPGQAGLCQGQAAEELLLLHRLHEIGHSLHAVSGKDKVRGSGDEENL